MRCGMAFAFILLGLSPALAATVASLQGQTLVNRGLGFQQIVGVTEVPTGSQIVVNPGGLGQVVYSDGCTVAVNPGTVYTILPASPCATGQGPSVNPYAIGAAVLGGTIGAIAFSQSKSASP